MPRQPRYFLPGIPQHVIQRGVNRQSVFLGPGDYDLYRRSLGEATRRYGCRVHAYVLMSNHTHLLMTPESERSIPLVMQAMGRNYVQAVNKRYGRTGTLWEGRYKASPVQDDLYLLTCYRYIELNPVRAGMVESPADFPHSSFRHNAQGQRDSLITPHDVYLSLASSPAARRAAYLKLFEVALSPRTLAEIRVTTNACLVLGDEQFRDSIEQRLGRSVRPGKSGRPRKREYYETSVRPRY